MYEGEVDPVTPRDAATVILLRPAAVSGYEVFLLRRRRGASFMGGAFVFPGGAADDGDGDLRITAARELFEEAGVLLAPAAPPPDELATMRRLTLDGAPLTPMLEARGVAIDPATLHYYAHWVTPSVEKKRFSARFYVAVLPPGQTPSFDDRETVDEAWVTPQAALARVAELALPPPQLRTFLELSAAPSIDDVLALSCSCAHGATNGTTRFAYKSLQHHVRGVTSNHGTVIQ